MSISMAGLEHSLVPIALREHLSFTKTHTEEMVRKIRSFAGVDGCVLISTCNRTELYISGAEELYPEQLLCRAAGADYEMYRDMFVCREDETAIQHLMEVAAGLRSRIWGEDQIISQVRDALTLARRAGTTDAVLETMFRYAVAAGKEVRTEVHLTALPTSAASMAVELLQKKLGSLEGRRAIVIGNGEMGRLAAALLHRAGCDVSVTLRSYRHGETIVPPGCGVVPFDERFDHIDGADLLLSATTSPHFTVTAEQAAGMQNPPPVMVDLAIPRDIEPQVGTLGGIALYNVDDLGNDIVNRTVPPEVKQILREHRDMFRRWMNYRDCMPVLDDLKQAIAERILCTQDNVPADVVAYTVAKTVDLLTGGLAERVTPEQLEHCTAKIRSRTRKNGHRTADAETSGEEQA